MRGMKTKNENWEKIRMKPSDLCCYLSSHLVCGISTGAGAAGRAPDGVRAATSRGHAGHVWQDFCGVSLSTDHRGWWGAHPKTFGSRGERFSISSLLVLCHDYIFHRLTTPV